jgi:hypothetical protein
MRGNGLVTLLIIVGIVCIAIGVFYFIPGIYHPFTFSGAPTDRHNTHTIAFIGLGVVALIASRFFRQSAN